MRPKLLRILSATLAFAVLMTPQFAASQDADRNALGIVYLQRTLTPRVSGVLSLPVVSTKDWYAVWFLLQSVDAAGRDKPFVQIGLIRERSHGHALRAFIAYQTRSRPVLIYDDAGSVSESSHYVELAMAGDRVVCRIDGKAVCSFPRTRFFGNEWLYVQAGVETNGKGNPASGSISQLQYNGSPVALQDLCGYTDRGISLNLSGSSLVANGRVQTKIGSHYALIDGSPVSACGDI